MAYKRKTQKTGPNTKRTTTQSSRGTRITNSTKSSLGGKNKRTYSWSWSKNGGLKQTFTDNRNGWISRKSRTLGGRKSKTYKAPRTRRTSSNVGLGFGYWIVMIILALLFLTFPMAGLVVAGVIVGIVVIWMLLPYLIGLAVVALIIWLFFL